VTNDEPAANVDDFIAAQPPTFQQTLNELRAIIRDEAPDAEERISYRVPAYKLNYMLISFGVTKSACSLYTQSPGLVERMSDELQGQRVSGTTLHFPPGEPLPEKLIRKIIRERIKEDEARASRPKG
jgi:uncharacterized protein YdhG (YjbR/CyaY superfamily)